MNDVRCTKAGPLLMKIAHTQHSQWLLPVNFASFFFLSVLYTTGALYSLLQCIGLATSSNHVWIHIAFSRSNVLTLWEYLSFFA